MPIEIQTALIAAFVALLTAAFTGFITWTQVQRERTKWLVDLKAAYSTELYKARLHEYPRVVQAMGLLSSRSPVPLTPESAADVANELNGWLYSAGGLIAEAQTRGAIVALRDRCLRWKDGARPDEIRQWRNAALFALRRDLDIPGLESFEGDDATLLAQLRREMEGVTK